MVQGKTSIKTERVEKKYLGKRFHLIGAGGVGMRALGQMLMMRGAIVSGSDVEHSIALDDLSARGGDITVGHRAENIPPQCDTVIYTVAIRPDNPELLAARQRGVELLKYSQMLGRLMNDKKGIAVAGTHGKSTTSAMIAYALVRAGRDPSFVIGADVDQLGGPSGVGGGEYFVAEACEYDKSFLNLAPTLATILNIEEDHLDYYKDISAIIDAFSAFVRKVPPSGMLIVNGQDENVASTLQSARCRYETFGLDERCTWRAENLSADRGRYSFDVFYMPTPAHPCLAGRPAYQRFAGRQVRSAGRCGKQAGRGSRFCRISLLLAGLHNVYDALAATAVLHHVGLSADEIASAVSGFEGVRRRMTLKGQLGGISVVDDYAHHPTEIQVTLRAAIDYFQPRRTWCVFQPHQHSRTRFLLKDFARSFGLADEIILPDIYFVRDSEREKENVSSADLVAQIVSNGGKAVYLQSFDSIVEYLKENLAPGDLVITMGAGDIWKVADEIVQWLGTNS